MNVTELIGKIISNYKLIEVGGQGGMGIVYIAEDTDLKHHVALMFVPLTIKQHQKLPGYTSLNPGLCYGTASRYIHNGFILVKIINKLGAL